MHHTRVVAGSDRLSAGNEVYRHGFVVLAEARVALGRALMVVEGHAGRNHIEQGKPAMTDRRFDKRHELRLVARKASANEGCPDLNAQSHQVNGHVGINVAFLADRFGIHRRGVLPLGQPITAVVLDDIGHVQVAAHHMGKLPHTNRGGIAVA